MDAQALGRYLRETREAKEITLDEAERALRIRRRILESFETGEFNLPEIAAIQVRGFMRNYARYLGLEEDRIVAYYEEALVEHASPRSLSGRATSRKRRDKRDSQPLAPVAPRSVTDTPPSLPAVKISATQMSTPVAAAEKRRRGANPLTLLFRLLVAAAALAVIAYVVVQLLQTNTAEPGAPEEGGIFGQLPDTPTSTIQPTIQLAFLPTTAPEIQSAFTGQGVLVTITLSERSWLQISADGVDQYIGIAPPGTALEYPAGSSVTVIASNAQALDVVYNGQPQPVFGGRGQLVTAVFTPNGVEISSGPGYEPTPINSPTPLPQPTDPAGALVAQLTPSDTPGPSPTPSDTLTPSQTPSETPIPTDTPVPTDTPIPSDTPTITPIPTDTPIPSNTPSPTLTPTFTLTPTLTPIPSDTPIPTATSILPPRGIPPNATPTKVGG